MDLGDRIVGVRKRIRVVGCGRDDRRQSDADPGNHRQGGEEAPHG